MIKKHICFVVMALFGLGGCQTHSTDQTPFIMITKSLGTKQCSEVNANDQLQQLKHELEQANIKVFAAEIGMDQMMHITLCGAEDGKMVVFKVKSNVLNEAEKMGYQLKVADE
ncbi:hypothetical protein [Acinetobacter sp. BSP-28]|uniref:hypothetical protein n=1 Tax=Acinetobacter sp. BSP-28 TaxID=3344661 RepID=UPI00376FAE97